VRFTLDELVVEGESCTRVTVTHVKALAAREGASAALQADRRRVEWQRRLRALVQRLGQSLVVSTWQR
jgi:hypothetical protein